MPNVSGIEKCIQIILPLYNYFSNELISALRADTGGLRSQGFFGGFFRQESFGAFLGTFSKVTKRLATAVLIPGFFSSVFSSVFHYSTSNVKTKLRDPASQLPLAAGTSSRNLVSTFGLCTFFLLLSLIVAAHGAAFCLLSGWQTLIFEIF